MAIRNIAITRARVHLGRIVRQVYLKGDTYVLEKNGIPLAALVPPTQVRPKRRR